jgi:hypothetical protein
MNCVCLSLLRYNKNILTQKKGEKGEESRRVEIVDSSHNEIARISCPNIGNYAMAILDFPPPATRNLPLKIYFVTFLQNTSLPHTTA